MKSVIILLFLLALNLQAKRIPPTVAFQTVVGFYNNLISKSNAPRHEYIHMMRNFSNFNKNYGDIPNSRSEDAKFYISALYSDLAFAYKTQPDFIIAYEKINKFIQNTRRSDLSARATTIKQKILAYAKENKISQITEGKTARDFGESLEKGLTHISRVEVFKNSITIHADKKLSYTINSPEPTQQKSYSSKKIIKVQIEVSSARLDNSMPKENFKSSVIKNLKIYQKNAKIAVIEFNSSEDLSPIVTETLQGRKVNFAMRPWDVVKQAHNELFKSVKVLIDPGHGGKDPGTAHNDLKEKDLTLAIAKALGSKLKSEGMDVSYTRDRDITLSLNERAAKAKELSPDIFISIHINSSADKRAKGIETYYFDVSSDETTKNIAMRENSNAGPISDLDFIFKDLIISKNFQDAGALAANVHKALISGLYNEDKQKVKNRGTRGGPFYLLYKTGVPSILLEVGFLSSTKEAGDLKTKNFQNLISTQIATGIKDFIKIKTRKF